MPQPLPKSKKERMVRIGNAPASRPALAVRAADVLSTWSILDMYLEVIASFLTKGDPQPVAAVFSSIRSNAGQIDALKALAAVSIEDQTTRDIFGALLRAYGSSAKARNVIAHHLWGTLDEFPDAILMIDPGEAAALQLLNQRAVHDAAALKDAEAVIDRYNSHIRAWRENDFVDAGKRTARLIVLFTCFMILISKAEPAEKDKARATLMREDEIKRFTEAEERRRGDGAAAKD